MPPGKRSRVARALAAIGATLSSASFAIADVPQASPAVPDVHREALARVVEGLDRDLGRMPAANSVPGMAVVIVKDGQVQLLKGYGLADVKSRRPVTPDTRFEIASCTKAFNSALVLFGVDQGKLSLADPPSKYLPWFHLRDPDADRKITVADLMCHRSGLPRIDLAWVTGRVSSDDLIRMACKAEPTYPFGLVGQYSNVLVQAAGDVVASAYGRPWEKLLQSQILGPLHMTGTTAASITSLDPATVATGYRVDEVGRIVPEVLASEGSIEAAGGVKSCARDMANWIQFHLDGGVFQGRRLISADVLGQAYRRWFEFGVDSYAGLGWFTDLGRRVPVIWHDGYLPGFQALVMLVPERKLGFAILTNNSGRGLDISAGQVILNRLIGKPDLRTANAAARATGLYFDPEGRHTLRLVRRDRTLFARLDDGGDIRLEPKGAAEWTSFDVRQGAVSLRLEPSPLREKPVRAVFSIKSGVCLDLTFDRTPKYQADITANELVARIDRACGAPPDGKRETRTLAARFAGDMPNESLSSIGLCFFGPGGQVGWFERDYGLGRPIDYTLAGISGGAGRATSDYSRPDEIFGDDIPADLLAPLPFQEADQHLKYRELRIVGKSTLRGVSVYLLLRKPMAGPMSLDYVSADQYFVLRREYGAWPVVELLDGYQTIDGRTVPTHITGIDTMAKVQEYRLTGLHFQSRSPHWAFHPLPWPGHEDPSG